MEGVLCVASCLISPARCSCRPSTSSSSINVSSSSSYWGHSRFGVQLPKRISRHRRQALRAVADARCSFHRETRFRQQFSATVLYRSREVYLFKDGTVIVLKKGKSQSHRQFVLARKGLTMFCFPQSPVPIPRRVTKVKETKEVIMVDPVEAKRLAAVEMEVLRAKQKLKKQRNIEATNGGFAVLGLTAGLVLEGYTGKGILNQIAGYLDGLADLLTQVTAPVTPSQEVLQEITSQFSSTQEVLQKVVNSQ